MGERSMEESESESESDEGEREWSSLMEGRADWAVIRETLARAAVRLSVDACLESEVRLTDSRSFLPEGALGQMTRSSRDTETGREGGRLFSLLPKRSSSASVMA